MVQECEYQPWGGGTYRALLNTVASHEATIDSCQVAITQVVAYCAPKE